jgi:hypothetical protein
LERGRLLNARVNRIGGASDRIGQWSWGVFLVSQQRDPGNAGCFCDKHWGAMCGCGLFNARVWLGCLRSGIELVKATRLDDAEPELVKAFVAGKLFFREHEVTTDAISVLADTASVLHLCLKQRSDFGLATEVVTSTAHTLSRVMHSESLRQEAMQACSHLLTLNEIPQQVPAAAQLAMARYVQSPDSVAH